MVTPNRKAILERAKELWHETRFRKGDPSFSIEPELDELREEGFLSAAQSTLMRDQAKAEAEQYFDYDQLNVSNFSLDVDEALQNGTYTCGTKGTGKTDLNMMIADRLMQHGVTVIVFDPTQDWQKRGSIPNYVVVKPYSIIEIPKQNMIYDLSLLTPQQQQKVVEDFNRRLFDYQVHDVLRKWIFVIYEEAHQYFRQGCMRAKNMQFSVRLLTQGRNYQIGVGMITQFSSLIDKDAMKYMMQRFIGASNEPNDVAYLKGFLGKHVDRLKTLKNGEFLLYHRGSVKLLEIEPYESNIAKTEVKPTELEPIEPIPTKQHQDNTEALASFAMLLIWLAILAIALSQH